MSSCFKDYYSRPFDFQISNKSYLKLFENRDYQHFDITIEGITYDFTLKLSSDSDANYIIKTTKNEDKLSNKTDSFSLNDFSDSSSNKYKNRKSSKTNISQSEKCKLLRRIFLGKSIMVDDLNISFLHHAAEAIGLTELSQIEDLSNDLCTKQSNQFIFYYKQNIFYIKHSIKSFFFKIWTNFFNFFCFFGFFGRLLQSFWDLSGPTMILCLFLNILILFITMALVTLKDYLVWFFIVVIPFLLYSLYFPNIMCIPIIEALERNLYLKETFFYSHQKLISLLIKIFFDVDKKMPKYICLGKLHSFIHGILFFIFMCGFFANVMNDKAPRFLNVWIIIFAFYVPLIRYFSLYIFYLIHSIVSLFNKPRRRFLELGDFDDPFLCSFYLNERNWIDFFLSKNKTKNKAIHFIFSKTTFSLLATIAVIVYMFCAETKMSAGQVCITIFIGICMIFVLSTRISFPFFWIIRRRDRRLTEGKIDEIHESIKFDAQQKIIKYKEDHESESQYILEEDEKSSLEDDEIYANDEGNNDNDNDNDDDVDVDESDKIDDVDEEIKENILRKVALKWHIQATTWSKRYSYLRWCSGILVCLVFLFVVILVCMGGSTAVSTSNESSTYQENITINRPPSYDNSTNSTTSDDNDYNENDAIRFPLSPICNLKTKGLSIIEIIALSMLANPPTPDNFTDGQWQIVDEFLAEKGEVGKDIIFVNTPFKWDKSFLSSMTLTRFRKEPKLSVFTIRGTANMQDAIADAEIWFASVVINIMNSFFPFVSIYSDKTIELIGVVTNLPRYAFKQFSLVEEYKNRFVDFIYEYIYGGDASPSIDSNNNNNIKNRSKETVFSNSASEWILESRKRSSKYDRKIDIHIDPDEDVLIIGHSLGGGLAKIISLVTGIQAVALSGPGVRFIGHFYQNKTVKNVGETIIDIIPGQDLVARVDMPIGTQINVPCKRGMSCHDANRLICQVSVMCNTFKKYAKFCEERFDNETIDEMFEIGEVVT